WDTASRQAKHDIVATAQIFKPRCQALPGVGSVAESHRNTPCCSAFACHAWPEVGSDRARGSDRATLRVFIYPDSWSATAAWAGRSPGCLHLRHSHLAPRVGLPPSGGKVVVMSHTQALQVETLTRGAVPEDAMDLAVLRVRAELRATPKPVRYAKIKLAMAVDPIDGEPAVAQASVDLNGRRIRAQAVAQTM